MTTNNEGFDALKEQPFVSHLLELRDRLLRAVIAVGVIFASLFYFSNDIYQLVAGPLMAHLPEGSSMIATEVASPFLTPVQTDPDVVDLYRHAVHPLPALVLYRSRALQT